MLVGEMSVEFIRTVLLWCAVINMGLLLWWWLVFALAHDWMYRVHSRWFKLSVEKFDSIHYTGMAFFKICIFVFNIVPLLALLAA